MSCMNDIAIRMENHLDISIEEKHRFLTFLRYIQATTEQLRRIGRCVPQNHPSIVYVTPESIVAEFGDDAQWFTDNYENMRTVLGGRNAFRIGMECFYYENQQRKTYPVLGRLNRSIMVRRDRKLAILGEEYDEYVEDEVPALHIDHNLEELIHSVLGGSANINGSELYGKYFECTFQIVGKPDQITIDGTHMTEYNVSNGDRLTVKSGRAGCDDYYVDVSINGTVYCRPQRSLPDPPQFTGPSINEQIELYRKSMLARRRIREYYKQVREECPIGETNLHLGDRFKYDYRWLEDWLECCQNHITFDITYSHLLVPDTSPEIRVEYLAAEIDSIIRHMFPNPHDFNAIINSSMFTLDPDYPSVNSRLKRYIIHPDLMEYIRFHVQHIIDVLQPHEEHIELLRNDFYDIPFYRFPLDIYRDEYNCYHATLVNHVCDTLYNQLVPMMDGSRNIRQDCIIESIRLCGKYEALHYDALELLMLTSPKFQYLLDGIFNTTVLVSSLMQNFNPDEYVTWRNSLSGDELNNPSVRQMHANALRHLQN